MGRSFLSKMLLGFVLAGGSNVAVRVGVVSQAGTWSRCHKSLRVLGNILPCLEQGGSISPVWQCHRGTLGNEFFDVFAAFSSFSLYQEVSKLTMLRRMEKNRGS